MPMILLVNGEPIGQERVNTFENGEIYKVL